MSANAIPVRTCTLSTCAGRKNSSNSAILHAGGVDLEYRCHSFFRRTTSREDRGSWLALRKKIFLSSKRRNWEERNAGHPRFLPASTAALASHNLNSFNRLEELRYKAANTEDRCGCAYLVLKRV